MASATQAALSFLVIGLSHLFQLKVWFLAPQMSLRLMGRVAHEDPRSVRSLRLGGVFALLLSENGTYLGVGCR